MKESPVPDSLRGVVLRFPGFEDRIRKEFQEDEQFRELCIDHGECVAALRRFEQHSASLDERIQQYTELLASLEEELTGRITRLANDRRGSDE